MGKFLNEYLETSGHGHLSDGEVTNVPVRYVPPGFSDWDVAGWGYAEFNYTLNENGVLHYYGHRPSEYLTDVVGRDCAPRVRRISMCCRQTRRSGWPATGH